MIGRWLGVGVFLAAVLVGATCDESPTSVAAFVGGHWVFTVDRAWNRASGRFTLESYEFTEADYEPTSSGQSYAVVLPSGGDSGFIGAMPIVAVRRTACADRVSSS